MKTHTPGPWSTNNNIGRKGEPGIVADAAPCIIAIMGNSKEWPAEAQANARLIAAAPDLLAALEFYVTICGNTAAVVDRESARLAYEQARAAIAKAQS